MLQQQRGKEVVVLFDRLDATNQKIVLDFMRRVAVAQAPKLSLVVGSPLATAGNAGRAARKGHDSRAPLRACLAK